MAINKTIVPFLLLSILLFGCSPNKPKEAVDDQPTVTAFKIKRGTNIAHWLSQSSRRGKERVSFFTKKDISFIDSAGFDHIRLPIEELQGRAFGIVDNELKPDVPMIDILTARAH
jgi:aryl-phospho-beta-D-glucosidase BglC (GH1 family)